MDIYYLPKVFPLHIPNKGNVTEDGVTIKVESISEFILTD